MLLFRSEEDVQRHLVRRGRSGGALVPVQTVWKLAQLWYGNRLDPAYRGRTVAEAEALFARVGLEEPFWRAG